MCISIRLIIIESDADKADIWRQVFADTECVSVRSARVTGTGVAELFDAEIMGGIFAHERFGGSPTVGMSQILASTNKAKCPIYVITTPPFPCQWHYEENEDGTLSIVTDATLSIIDGTPIDSVRMAYESFKTVFAAVGEFNSSGSGVIRSLGFVPQLCGILDGVVAHAKAVKNAYLEAVEANQLGL